MLDVCLHTDPTSPNNRSVPLTLPASRRDLLAAQADLRADSLREVFVEIVAVPDYRNLNSCLRHVRAENDLTDKLNFFASRLQDMSPEDRWSLDAMCCLRGPENMRDLINLSYSAGYLVSEPDVSTEKELGEFLVENGFREFPDEVVPYLDFAKIGREHYAENTCGFIDNAYCEHTGDVAAVYDGVTLPERSEPDFIFQIELAEPENAADVYPTVMLALPTDDEDIAEALNTLSVPSLSDCVIVNGRSDIERFDGLIDDETDPAWLNHLAGQIAVMSDDEYIKFLAVAKHQQALESDDPVQSLADLALRLDGYRLDPAIIDAEQLARNELSLDCPDLLPFVDLEAYGRHWLGERDASVGNFGYVREMITPEMAQSFEPVESCGPEMGGM